MRWDGDGMKIIRLSLFNLRKNRREALAIIFLTFITVFLLGTVATNIVRINKIYDECFAATGSYDSMILFRDAKYRSVYKDILAEEYGIEDAAKCKCLIHELTDIVDENGEKVSQNLYFITEESERRIEDFLIDDSLDQEQIASLEHPIWLPQYFGISQGYKPGDDFVIVSGGRNYPFVVAGLFECGFGNNPNELLRTVIGERDYMLLSGIFTEGDILAFDAGEGFEVTEYLSKCEDRSSENLAPSTFRFSLESARASETNFLNIFMYLSIFLSVITMAAALFLIRHKISNDIEDQMQQIGVLEALGYKSREISVSYICEYVITGGIGAVFGIIAAMLFTPVMNTISSGMLYRVVTGEIEVSRMFLVGIAVVALVTLFALLKARMVKNYPPVVAFRRGIRTHHFGKSILPLERTSGNINIRLAFKSYFKNIRQGFGTGLCIALAGIALLFCVCIYDFFRTGYDGLITIMGMEVADERLNLLDGVDADIFAEELRNMPEVRKALVTYNLEHLSVEGFSDWSAVQVYDDFNETENIFLNSGSFPECDNEIAVSLHLSILGGYKVGDSITILGDGTKKSYLITGIVPAMSNEQMNIYMTTEGYTRVRPNDLPDIVEVYLNDGVGLEQFEDMMTARYGVAARSGSAGVTADGTLEERIRSVADEKMATLISNYGVTNIDYAVVVGDQVITGQSNFVIRDMSSLLNLAKTQVLPIAGITKAFSLGGMVFVAIVVAVILSIIASSNVRRQRKDLGIMKSMGYSSKDLMTQMAISMLSTIVIAVILATLANAYLYRMFWLTAFGAHNPAPVPLMIAADIALAVFCYIVTYIAAGRVKKVSVTELMTE